MESVVLGEAGGGDSRARRVPRHLASDEHRDDGKHLPEQSGIKPRAGCSLLRHRSTDVA
jgi:hypothetical protein